MEIFCVPRRAGRALGEAAGVCIAGGAGRPGPALKLVYVGAVSLGAGVVALGVVRGAGEEGVAWSSSASRAAWPERWARLLVMASPGAGRPGPALKLVYVGAASLSAGVVALGVVRASGEARVEWSSSASRAAPAGLGARPLAMVSPGAERPGPALKLVDVGAASLSAGAVSNGWSGALRRCRSWWRRGP